MISSGTEKVVCGKGDGFGCYKILHSVKVHKNKLICFRSLTNLKVQTGANRLLTDVFIYVHGMCACVCVHALYMCYVCVLTYVCACEFQVLTSGDFFYHSSLYFLRHNFSLVLKLNIG